ncbi:MAG: DUF4404 family protein [Gammaproteobacteria bacterium]
MSEERLKEIMAELVSELEKTEAVEPETLDRARRMQADIDDLINPEVDTTENTILDDAIALEASFAARHPLAEKTIREFINTLSRIGI